MSDIKRESPLAGQQAARRGATPFVDPGVRLTERPFLGHITLRGKSDDSAFTRACGQVLGVDLPLQPNTQAIGEHVVVCWMGPTEWLVLVEPETGPDWVAAFNTALAGVHAGVVSVSGGQTTISIRGRHAVDTLAKSTPLDLHARCFTAGQCTRTLMAKTTTLIRVIEPGEAFELVVRRSFAEHLWRWLLDSAEEYGVSVEAPVSALDLAGRDTTAAPARQVAG